MFAIGRKQPSAQQTDQTIMVIDADDPSRPADLPICSKSSGSLEPGARQ
jgi:hypothetical protein